MEITGNTQDNSSLYVGESCILSIPIREVSTLEINSSRTIPSNTEGILRPRSFLPSRDIPAKMTRAPSKTRISHWCSSATLESPNLPAIWIRVRPAIVIATGDSIPIMSGS